MLRQLAQYTSAKYIFLSYGETGKSAGGAPGSVSHHTGANYQTDKLEAVIIRFAREEISYLTDTPLEQASPYFDAVMISTENNDQTLSKLFSQATGELLDYSTYRIGKDTTVAILPIDTSAEDVKATAEYFTERLVPAGSASTRFRLVERTDLQKIIDEQKLELSGLTDTEQAAKLGELLNVDVLVTGTLYEKDDYELFLKMLRVSTAEVLSVTRAIIDRKLCLH